MSEKTLGEVVRDAWFESPARGAVAWQAAADAIAAPLLARIAELEGELEEKETERREQCIHCIDEPEGAIAQVVAQYETLGRENATLRAEAERLKQKKEVLTGQLQLCYANTHERETEAYHRGVAEERERCAKVVEDEGFSHCSCVDRERRASCGTVDDILERIRSASPAVDVTSDKGGER